MTGAFLMWQSRASPARDFRRPHPAIRRIDAQPVSRCRRRKRAPKAARRGAFHRADKNKDGKIESEELLGSRRKAFAKLDKNGNGALSFDEWATKTIDKFQGADRTVAVS